MATLDKSKKVKKEMNKRINKKRNEESDSDDDGRSTHSSDEENEMDDIEYRKFLKKMFPSKHMDKKVEAGERLKKVIGKSSPKAQSHNTRSSKTNKKNSIKTSSRNKKVVEEEDQQEEDEDDDEEEEVEKIVSSKSNKSKSKSSKKMSKKKVIVESDEDDEEEEWEDVEEDDDAGVVELNGKSNKFNIIFTIGSAAEGEDEWEDEDYDEEYEEAFGDEEETENEDDSVSDSEASDLDEDEEDEVEIVTKTKRKSNKVAPEESVSENVVVSSSKEQNSNDDEAFLTQLKDIYEKNKDNLVAKKCFELAEESVKINKQKIQRKTKKTQERNVRIFRKIVRDKNTMNDFDFFQKLEIDHQKKIIKELREINKITRVEKPYRLSLLDSDMPPLFKGAAMKKINSLRYMEPGSGEYYKIKNWVDTFMRIPFGKNQTLPVSIADGQDVCHEFMENAKNTLDSAVYGLNDAKMQIMQMLGQLITNPSAIGSAIAIHGPMGTGKTSIVKEGISKILNRPFAFIALGGATDSSFLEGHSYTYEGSTWGKIVQILIDSKCMNPVIYFDELDKISDTPKGEEIAGILTHLTDTTQNSQFHDKYFSEVDFDLSKCLFIFSYNDESKVNPILRDRMYRIKTKGYDKKQKTVICNNYLLPKIREQVKFAESDIVIPEETLQYIMETHCNGEDGVRTIKRCLEIIYTKLNLYRLMKPGSNLFDEQKSLTVEFPLEVTKDIVDKLIIKERDDNMAIRGMYV
jgi:ATP-dependent Lon protease